MDSTRKKEEKHNEPDIVLCLIMCKPEYLSFLHNLPVVLFFFRFFRMLNIHTRLQNISSKITHEKGITKTFDLQQQLCVFVGLIDTVLFGHLEEAKHKNCICFCVALLKPDLRVEKIIKKRSVT